MSDPANLPSKPPSPERRERTIAALSSLFAAGKLELDEFESRVDRAVRVATVAELDALLADLAPSAGAAVPATVSQETAVTAQPGRRGGSFSLAFMSGTIRRGRWVPERRHYAAAVMGGVELDFRDAELPPGSTTDVYALTWWGGVEVWVPPGVTVETSGLAIMGGLERVSNLAKDPRAPRVRVHALAVMGAVVVRVKKPRELRGGEGARRIQPGAEPAPGADQAG
jgi:hypothetical protein